MTPTESTSTRDLRDAVDALPEVEERPTWGRPTFRVAERMFVVLSPDETHASIRTTLAEQAALLARDPAVFEAAPYVGRHGWVRVRLDGVAPEELRELVAGAWSRTAPRRLAA